METTTNYIAPSWRVCSMTSLEGCYEINLSFSSLLSFLCFLHSWTGSKPEALHSSTDNSSIDKIETSSEWQEYFSQFQDTTDALHCHIHLPVCLWIMDPHSRAPKKNTSHGNEVLPQDTRHLIQRPCYQRGSPCKKIQRATETHEDLLTIVKRRKLQWYGRFLFIRSCQNHLARHSERGKKTRQTEEEVGRKHQGMDRPWVRQVPMGSGEQE